MIVVKRAEALMTRNTEPESLCDPLYGKVAELLYFKLVHHLRFRNFSVLV